MKIVAARWLALIAATITAAFSYSDETTFNIVGQWETDSGAIYEFRTDKTFTMTFPYVDADVLMGTWTLKDEHHIRTLCTAMGITVDLTRAMQIGHPNGFALQGSTGETVSLARVTPAIPPSEWKRQVLHAAPLPMPARAAPAERTSYRFTSKVENPLLRRVLARDGYMNDDGESASRIYSAVFFDQPIPIESENSGHQDTIEPVGAYLAFARAYRIDGSIFDTLKFYQPAEIEQLRAEWTKNLQPRIACTWTRTCYQRRAGIRGYVEVGNAIYIVAQGITIMRKTNGSWRVSTVPEDDFASWLLPRAIANNGVEPAM